MNASQPLGGCPGGDLLARFVDGDAQDGEASTIERHLGTCARCRSAVSELRALIKELARDPDPRMAGLPDLAPMVLARAALPPPRRNLVRPIAAALSLAAALCAGIFVEQQRAARDDAGFQARGGAASPDQWIALHAFAIDGRKQPAPRPVALQPNDSLANCDARLLIAYDNGGPRPYRWLTVVAIDERGHVEWLFPDGKGGSGPGAGSIAAEPGLRRELHEEVPLDEHIDSTTLHVYGVFTEEPLAIADIERALPVGAHGERLPIAGSGQHRVDLHVTHCEHAASSLKACQ